MTEKSQICEYIQSTKSEVCKHKTCAQITQRGYFDKVDTLHICTVSNDSIYRNCRVLGQIISKNKKKILYSNTVHTKITRGVAKNETVVYF